jgi:hypothetical protein
MFSLAESVALFMAFLIVAGSMTVFASPVSLQGDERVEL